MLDSDAAFAFTGSFSRTWSPSFHHLLGRQGIVRDAFGLSGINIMFRVGTTYPGTDVSTLTL
eukprot:1510173-Rhodomonas_salina.1